MVSTIPVLVYASRATLHTAVRAPLLIGRNPTWWDRPGMFPIAAKCATGPTGWGLSCIKSAGCKTVQPSYHIALLLLGLGGLHRTRRRLNTTVVAEGMYTLRTRTLLVGRLERDACHRVHGHPWIAGVCVLV
jgi:hypothetical protein